MLDTRKPRVCLAASTLPSITSCISSSIESVLSYIELMNVPTTLYTTSYEEQSGTREISLIVQPIPIEARVTLIVNSCMAVTPPEGTV